VPHVELSLSEALLPGDDVAARRPLPRYPGASGSTLECWSFAVATAAEPCLLMDAAGLVVSASPGCRDLFGIDPYNAVGRHLIGDVLRLLDFTASSGELPDAEIDKVPPVLSFTSGGLARGLMRVAGHGRSTSTVDAISTALRDGDTVVGSLTFFAPVRH
jgi:hypothetical protein